MHLPDALPVPCTSFSAVAEAVRFQRADCGILPIRNTIIGPITGATQLIEKPCFKVVQIIELPVILCLLVRKGIAPPDVRAVVSCGPAISQCRRYLAKQEWELKWSASTSDAAAIVASSDQPLAAIASERAAERYSLWIAARGIQDKKDNVTSFAIFAFRETAI